MHFKPFMEYAASYALYNYQFRNPDLVEPDRMDYENLKLVRAFEHGLDPSSSEAGFVLVHVAMVRWSFLLVRGAVGVVSALSGGDEDIGDGNERRDRFDEGLRTLVEGLMKVNGVMESMCVYSIRLLLSLVWSLPFLFPLLSTLLSRFS